MTYVERLNVLHFPFPVPVVTLVWLQEFFNEVVVIHKHIYCLQLTRITCNIPYYLQGHVGDQSDICPYETISNTSMDQNHSNMTGSRLDMAPLICRFPPNR